MQASLRIARGFMITQKGEVLLLSVKVVPNSSRTQVAGVLGAALKVKVAQPPEDGKANRAVIALLVELLGVAPSQVTLISGQTRAQKLFEIRGVSIEVARERLSGRE